ncbi:MAG: cyclase [Actinomycetia bacterium]|nr:cyclase [Actinomycetes bacterium]MCP4224652.1 cyclase [Actinomycetes bacterium]MCP5032186.1 cyclase [Actinomycetes bacterium]
MHEIPAKAHTVVLTTVAAPVGACFEVAIDLDTYPEWVKGITSVEVQERDDQGRPLRARFEATAVGRTSAYTLSYDLDREPTSLSWSMVEGDLTSRLEGTYLFEPSPTVAEGEIATDVTYELLVDLAVPLPGYVKRRVEDKIVEAALERFKNRVESFLP